MVLQGYMISIIHYCLLLKIVTERYLVKTQQCTLGSGSSLTLVNFNRRHFLNGGRHHPRASCPSKSQHQSSFRVGVEGLCIKKLGLKRFPVTFLNCFALEQQNVFPNSCPTTLYTQQGPITNGGVTMPPDTAVCYRTLLRVSWQKVFTFPNEYLLPV